MTKAPAKKPQPEAPNIPFDEAVRRMLNAPPDHKTAKKPPKAKRQPRG